MFNTLILAISNNGKYLIKEESPLSAQVNQFLNPAYFTNLKPFALIIFFVVAVFIIIKVRK